MSDVQLYKSDVRQLRPLIEAWTEEANGEPFGITLDVDYMVLHMARLVAGTTGALFVAWSEEKPIGFFGVEVFASPTGPQLMAEETYWYVIPEHRGQASMELFRAAREFVSACGCSHFILSSLILASDRHERVCRLCQRLGGEKFEERYLFRV